MRTVHRLVEDLAAIHDVKGELQVQDLRIVAKTDAVKRRTCIDDLCRRDGHVSAEN
jgi:hypothetical protein